MSDLFTQVIPIHRTLATVDEERYRINIFNLDKGHDKFLEEIRNTLSSAPILKFFDSSGKKTVVG